jgi:hypothetical protein
MADLGSGAETPGSTDTVEKSVVIIPDNRKAFQYAARDERSQARLPKGVAGSGRYLRMALSRDYPESSWRGLASIALFKKRFINDDRVMGFCHRFCMGS